MSEPQFNSTNILWIKLIQETRAFVFKLEQGGGERPPAILVKAQPLFVEIRKKFKPTNKRILGKTKRTKFVSPINKGETGLIRNKPKCANWENPGAVQIANPERKWNSNINQLNRQRQFIKRNPKARWAIVIAKGAEWLKAGRLSKHKSGVTGEQNSNRVEQ